MSTIIATDPAVQYEIDGYFLAPKLLPDELITRTSQHMDDVIAGKYETGVAPMDFRQDKDPTKLVKIDNPHHADRTILEAISHPELGRWAAKVTGAKMIQAWIVQLLYKPSGGQQLGNVGWHQDQQYWQNWWEEGSEVFTAWLAISDVTPEAGPMIFVPGSQRWGLLNEGDFFGKDNAAMKASIQNRTGEEWSEVPAVMPPGACSFHHRFVYHGSGANVSGFPRRSFAIHLRTEKSKPKWIDENISFHTKQLEDLTKCPILYQE